MVKLSVQWRIFLRSHGCSWPNRNVTISRSVKFRIRTWCVYKHIHLYACIFEVNFSFMHSLVISEDIKIMNKAVKTCDYQVPNCFWPTYSVVDSEKNSTWTGELNVCSYWFPYIIHKVLLSCINWREEMSLCKMIYKDVLNNFILRKKYGIEIHQNICILMETLWTAVHPKNKIH